MRADRSGALTFAVTPAERQEFIRIARRFGLTMVAVFRALMSSYLHQTEKDLAAQCPRVGKRAYPRRRLSWDRGGKK